VPGISGSAAAYRCSRAADRRSIHTGIDALPFCSLTLKAKVPQSKQYPKEINTLGDHLRKRRLDLGLLQREVAEKFGVAEATIWNWERQRTQPEIRFIAPIIKFLGYDPLPQPESFPEKLKVYRLRLGMSQDKLAFKLGVDTTTISGWELCKYKPITGYQKMIYTILSIDYVI
jgi:transcriptional regulator with XRE-family HTH domain